MYGKNISDKTPDKTLIAVNNKQIAPTEPRQKKKGIYLHPQDLPSIVRKKKGCFLRCIRKTT